MEQEKFMETARLLSKAGASKEVIVHSLIQQGADPNIAKKVGAKVNRGKYRKRILPFLLVVVAVVALMYVIFGRMMGNPLQGFLVALFIIPTVATQLFHKVGDNNKGRNMNKR